MKPTKPMWRGNDRVREWAWKGDAPRPYARRRYYSHPSFSPRRRYRLRKWGWLPFIAMLWLGLFASRETWPGEVEGRTPQGHRISLRNTPDSRVPPLRALGQTLWYVHDHSEYLWVAVALEHDSPIVWPVGQHVYLTTPQGEVRDTVLLVSDPPLVMRPQAARGRTLDPGRLWRQRFGSRVATVMLAAFPRSEWTRSDVTALRVGR